MREKKEEEENARISCRKCLDANSSTSWKREFNLAQGRLYGRPCMTAGFWNASRSISNNLLLLPANIHQDVLYKKKK